MTSYGIIYQLSGLWTAELCVVSIASLRRFFDGRVVLFVTDDCREIGELIANDKRLNVELIRTELPTAQRKCSHCQKEMKCEHCHKSLRAKREHWVTKTFCYLQSPFDYSIYIDSDTTVEADPTPLFGHLTLTKCNDLRILDDHRYPRSIRQQFKKFREFGPIMSGMIDACYKANRWCINNGVIAFSRNHPLLRELHHISIGLCDQRMHDEIAMQLVLPNYDDVRFVDGKWNALVAYQDDFDKSNVRHFHHKYYADLRRGRDAWLPVCRWAIDENFAQLREWCGKHNERIATILSGRKPEKSVN